MSRLARSAAAALLLAGIACRGDAADAQKPGDIARIVAELEPRVEQAAGLEFRTPPRSAMRTRDDVRRYLEARLDEELPPERAEAMETAYRLFGLLPDTLQLRPLLLDLLTEQVVGFYDPDSAMLFGVIGGDTLQLRVMLAHEMVHALQGQHLPLDSILEQRGDNDRALAAQAILEGQAMFASLRALVPDPEVLDDPAVWEELRSQAGASQQSMPRFAAAPRIVREELLFPYLAGAEFMRWWRASGPADTLPFGPRMPVSTEQILHPARYAAGDEPLRLEFADSSDAVLTEDTLGELELRLLETELTGRDVVGSALPAGWGGDRYRVYRAPGGPALVWYVVFDSEQAAGRFRAATGAALAARHRPGYRSALEPLMVDGKPAVRWVFAPAEWAGWGSPPAIAVAR